MLKKLLLMLLALFGVMTVNSIYAEGLEKDHVTVNRIKIKNYYHISFELNKNNFQINTKYGFNEGGVFEVFIPKKYFPISAPNCKNKIILRMPWTDNKGANATQYIQEKKDLFDILNNIGDQKVNVVVELNPYIKITDANKHKVELTRCNVFFRHSGDRYISTL